MTPTPDDVSEVPPPHSLYPDRNPVRRSSIDYRTCVPVTTTLLSRLVRTGEMGPLILLVSWGIRWVFPDKVTTLLTGPVSLSTSDYPKVSLSCLRTLSQVHRWWFISPDLRPVYFGSNYLPLARDESVYFRTPYCTVWSVNETPVLE